MTRMRLPAALLLLALAPLAVSAPAEEVDAPDPGLDPTPEASADPETAAPADTLPEPAPAPVPRPAFEGLTWQLAAFRSGDALAEPQPGRRPALFQFELGKLAGSPGCNRLLGRYTLEGDKIRFEPQMATSMMACPEPLMAQDRAVGEAFARADRVRLEGDLLELQDPAGKPLLRLLQLKPEPLVGALWELESLDNGKQGIVSVQAGTQLSLELHEDGTLGGFDGCNRFMSGYTLEQGKLAIGPLATTRMACRGPKGAQEQAAQFAAALATVVGYRIEGDNLTLLNDRGRTAASFRTPRLPAAQPVPGATTEATRSAPTDRSTSIPAQP